VKVHVGFNCSPWQHCLWCCI